MRWQDELAAKIEAMTENDWEEANVHLPSGVIRPRRFARFDVHCEEDNRVLLYEHLNQCNAKTIGRYGPGFLRLLGFSTYPNIKTKLDFLLSDRPHNDMLRSDGTWHVYRDSTGDLLYRLVDFDAIR